MLDHPIPTPACQKPIIKMLTGQMSPNYTLSDTSKRAQCLPQHQIPGWIGLEKKKRKPVVGSRQAGRTTPDVVASDRCDQHLLLLSLSKARR